MQQFSASDRAILMLLMPKTGWRWHHGWEGLRPFEVWIVCVCVCVWWECLIGKSWIRKLKGGPFWKGGGALFSPAQKERETHRRREKENKRTALSFFFFCRNNTPAAQEGREDILTLERNRHYYFLKIKGTTKKRKGGEKLFGCQPISDLRFRSFQECVFFVVFFTLQCASLSNWTLCITLGVSPGVIEPWLDVPQFLDNASPRNKWITVRLHQIVNHTSIRHCAVQAGVITAHGSAGSGLSYQKGASSHLDFFPCTVLE